MDASYYTYEGWVAREIESNKSYRMVSGMPHNCPYPRQCRCFQGGDQDDEFALDEDDDRGDRQRGRSRVGKAPSNKGKNKGEKDVW